MKYTDELNLKKPEQDDFYDVDDFNDNADILDETIKNLLIGKANVHDHPYLPLAGGIMTGNLTVPKVIGALQGNADTATKATQDASGNVITNTYIKKSDLSNVATSGSYNDLSNKPSLNYLPLAGGTLNGALTLNQSLRMTTKYNDGSNTTYTCDILKANTSNAQYGQNVSFGGNGNTIVGAGESWEQQLNELSGNTHENLYCCADAHVFVKTNCDNFSQANVFQFTQNGLLKFPNGKSIDGTTIGGIVAQSLGTNGYAKYANGLIIQWGIIISAAKDTTSSLTFPIAFGTAYAAVFGSNSHGSSFDYSFEWASDISTTGISYRSGGANRTNIYWVAVGKA